MAGIGLYGGDPIGSKALTDLGIEAVETNPSDVIGAAFGQGLAANITPRMFRAAGRYASETGVIGVDEWGNPITAAPDPPLDVDAANAEFGIPGLLKFDHPVTRDVAQDLHDHHRDELLRQDVLTRPMREVGPSGGGILGAVARLGAEAGVGIARLGAPVVAGLLDPLNLAVGFIPIAREARLAGLAARAFERVAPEVAVRVAPEVADVAGVAGRGIGDTFGVSAAAEVAPSLEQAAARRVADEAALAAMSVPERAALRFGVLGTWGAETTAPLVAAEYALSRQEQQDYTMADALRSIALGTVVAGGLHVGAGALVDRATGRYRNPVTQALEEAGPDVRQGLLQGSLGQTIDGQPANLKPVLDLVPNPVRLGTPAIDEIAPGVESYPLLRDEFRVGEAHIAVVNGGKSAIVDIVDGPRQLGIAESRELARQFFEEHPGVETIQGARLATEGEGPLTRAEVMRPPDASFTVAEPGVTIEGAPVAEAVPGATAAGEPVTATPAPAREAFAAAPSRGTSRPTDTLAEIEAQTTELEQLRQGMAPKPEPATVGEAERDLDEAVFYGRARRLPLTAAEKARTEAEGFARAEAEAATAAMAEAEGHASAYERAAFCIARGLL